MGGILTLAVAVGAARLGGRAFGRWTEGLDARARLGLHGLLALGTLGFLCLPLGLIPGGYRVGPWIVAALGLVGLVLPGWRDDLRGARVGRGSLPFLLGIGILLVLPLVGALAPADTVEWDSLAYHLAVPKTWLEAGRMTYVSTIHHSNFPLSVDGLFVWGLAWGGETGAKMFSFAILLFGLLAVGGVAAGRSGGAGGRWAALAYAATPLVLWLSGTAYIDVAHGLFAGLGIWFALSSVTEGSRRAVLGGLLLGFAAGSKYTGLQTIGIAALVGGVCALVYRARWGAVVAFTLTAVAVAAPWYVRNAVQTGNPVYPFFYSKLGGRDWSEFQARIYTHEQQTFGAGRSLDAPDYAAGPLEPARVGGAALGLAYQPGRYINPAPTTGGGFPFGSIGAVLIAAGLAAPFVGRRDRQERAVLAGVLLSLGAWFVLSQQARYILALAPLLAVIAGGLIAERRFRALGFAVALQAVIAFGVQFRFLTAGQLPVALGQEDREAWRTARVSFAKPAMAINADPGARKIALYDEVFGFLLDKPYLWANPGHSSELGYDRMRTGGDLADALKRAGVDTVYFNLGLSGPEFAQRWAAAAQGGPDFPPEERAGLLANPEVAWKVLLADAVREGRLTFVQAFGSKLIYRLE